MRSIWVCLPLGHAQKHSGIAPLATIPCCVSSTCGCADPQSALFPKSRKFGCPMVGCKVSEVYKWWFCDIPCETPRVEDLLGHPNWIAFRKNMRSYDDNSGRDLILIAMNLFACGCAALTSTVMPLFCQQNYFWVSFSSCCGVLLSASPAVQHRVPWSVRRLEEEVSRVPGHCAMCGRHRDGVYLQYLGHGFPRIEFSSNDNQLYASLQQNGCELI